MKKIWLTATGVALAGAATLATLPAPGLVGRRWSLVRRSVARRSLVWRLSLLRRLGGLPVWGRLGGLPVLDAVGGATRMGVVGGGMAFRSTVPIPTPLLRRPSLRRPRRRQVRRSPNAAGPSVPPVFCEGPVPRSFIVSIRHRNRIVPVGATGSNGGGESRMVASGHAGSGSSPTRFGAWQASRTIRRSS